MIQASNGVLVVLVLLASAACVWDLRTGRLPNALTLWGLGIGALAQSAAVLVMHGFGGSAAWLALRSVLTGVGCCGAGAWLLFRLGVLGGGDVKLMAAFGALLGPEVGAELACTSFAALAAALAIRLSYRGGLVAALLSAGRAGLARRKVAFSPRSAGRAAEASGLRLPLGPASLAGAAWVLAAHWRLS